MGYIDKTVSKNETLIKQAKICKMSFLDRYVAGALFILGAAFILVGSLFRNMSGIEASEEVTVPLSSFIMAGVGVLNLLIVVLLGLYRLVQAIFKADKDDVIPGTVFGRLALYGVLGILVGVLTYVLSGTALDAMVCDIINLAAAFVIGALIILFAILKYISIKLVVTDKRVFGRRNIWRTKSFDLPIDKADNIVISFSFWGKMFNYATVIIRAVEGEYKIKYVKSAEEFKNLIIDFAENKRG